MAIVQISKIQVRRGVKGESDVPALEPGEFGWAIDTHELYIGNDRNYDYFYDQQMYDSTGYEPFVPGSMFNTRILTTNDFNKITELAKYRYSEPSNHFVISLQEKLEQIVFVEDFGANVDLIDNVVEFQKAVNRIGTKRVLHLQPGVYKIGTSVSIPENAMIHGSGEEKTVIEFASGGFNVSNNVVIKDVKLRAKSSDTLLTVNGNNVTLQCDIEYEEVGNTSVGIAAAYDTIDATVSVKNCDVGISASTLLNSTINMKCKNVNSALTLNLLADCSITVEGAPVSVSQMVNSKVSITDYRNSGNVLPGSGEIVYNSSSERGTISILNGNTVSHESTYTGIESNVIVNPSSWQTVNSAPINYHLTVTA